MSDGAPAETAALATGDVADPAPALAGSRPFARPTPTNGGRPTPPVRPAPFVAPEPDRADAADPDSAPAGHAVPDSGARQANAAIEQPRMSWPAPVEVAAADALGAVARRLRAGSLRLPVAVDPGCPPALLAVVLAALHAEASAPAEARPPGGER